MVALWQQLSRLYSRKPQLPRTRKHGAHSCSAAPPHRAALEKLDHLGQQFYTSPDTLGTDTGSVRTWAGIGPSENLTAGSEDSTWAT